MGSPESLQEELQTCGRNNIAITQKDTAHSDLVLTIGHTSVPSNTEIMLIYSVWMTSGQSMTSSDHLEGLTSLSEDSGLIVDTRWSIH